MILTEKSLQPFLNQVQARCHRESGFHCPNSGWVTTCVVYADAGATTRTLRHPLYIANLTAAGYWTENRLTVEQRSSERHLAGELYAASSIWRTGLEPLENPCGPKVLPHLAPAL